ncbi:uncharacterized protein LOC126368191 [Pectinophora gossypiella]|uniref:uncharacterized protein LOC126368191 n=1 Tax=Pectinophora gossypiella TaxID=13191 RepID=UPI00214E6B0F|nr:uncharacterized protein LOC126368191 [Pectinophora gossypiella]
MRNNLTWVLFLILPCVSVWARPLEPAGAATMSVDAVNMPKLEDASEPEQVISVRITSSVAVGRGKNKPRTHENKHRTSTEGYSSSIITVNSSTDKHTAPTDATMAPELAGANIEFIKQLHSKKESRGLQNFEGIHTFPSNIENQYSNETDSIAEPSVKSVLEVETDEDNENIEQIPLGRSLSLSPAPKNFIQGLTHKPSERGNNPRLTTVSFNILHDRSKVTGDYSEPSDTYNTQRSVEVPKFYNEPAKVYSQPAQVYSEPAKFYSEPAKVYSEPAKVYSEPAKVYSEPAKIYSEPAKFYSQPASLHLPAGDYKPWQPTPVPMSSVTTPINAVTMTTVTPSKQRIIEQMPEKNYEVDEKLSVLTDGRSHGVQESSTESCKQENCKVGYVVEGRQYRKYRVEERTADGFIVGEYGVVRHEDGALRGVRYTADSDASPRLIYDALMKFLQLK